MGVGIATYSARLPQQGSALRLRRRKDGRSCQLNICVFSASLRCRGYLDYFLGALPRRRAGKSIWLTLSIEKAIGSKS